MAARPSGDQARVEDAAGAALARRPRQARHVHGGAAMTGVAPPVRSRTERLDLIWEERPGLLGWLTTVDHKRIGLLYFFTTLAFFAAGGIEALLIRTQLAGPNGSVLSPEAYNEVM